MFYILQNRHNQGINIYPENVSINDASVDLIYSANTLEEAQDFLDREELGM
jgi:hypothetical protein